MILIITNFISVTADPLPEVMPLYALSSIEATFLIRMTLLSRYVWIDRRVNHSG